MRPTGVRTEELWFGTRDVRGNPSKRNRSFGQVGLRGRRFWVVWSRSIVAPIPVLRSSIFERPTVAPKSSQIGGYHKTDMNMAAVRNPIKLGPIHVAKIRAVWLSSGVRGDRETDHTRLNESPRIAKKATAPETPVSARSVKGSECAARPASTLRPFRAATAFGDCSYSYTRQGKFPAPTPTTGLSRNMSQARAHEYSRSVRVLSVGSLIVFISLK